MIIINIFTFFAGFFAGVCTVVIAVFIILFFLERREIKSFNKLMREIQQQDHVNREFTQGNSDCGN